MTWLPPDKKCQYGETLVHINGESQGDMSLLGGSWGTSITQNVD